MDNNKDPGFEDFKKDVEYQLLPKTKNFRQADREEIRKMIRYAQTTYALGEALENINIKYGLSIDIRELQRQQTPTEQAEEKAEIILPKTGKLISTYAEEIANIISDQNVMFYRTNSREVVEVGDIQEDDKEETYLGFIPVKPSRFITLAERYFNPTVIIATKKGDDISFEHKHKSMTADLSNTILQSHILEHSLPKINRIFTIPIPIIYEDKLTFPTVGYDPRFKSWMPHNPPKINDEMTLEEAKEVIHNLLKEFCFQTPQDQTQAIAGLITPFCRGLYNKFNARTPVFVYLGNRERCGKDYLAGINGLIYEGVSLQEPPISNLKNKGSSDDELRKKLLSAFLSGRKRLHFANNKGYLNNAVFEAITTAETYSDRLLGKNESPIFNNELEFSLSGNIGIGFTPDLANRSRFVKLFLDVEDANARTFERPNLHQWILENRGLILSALYSLVRNWFDKGCPQGGVSFASYPEWARVCGGVMEQAGYDSPCTTDKETLAGMGVDSETQDMKLLFELCYEKNPDVAMTKAEIRDLIKSEGEDIFTYLDFDKKADQTRFGMKFVKFVGRVLSDIRLSVVDSSVRSSRQQYFFTKENYGQKDNGNLGNPGKLLAIMRGKRKQLDIPIGERSPPLPTLPDWEEEEVEEG